MKKTPTVRLSGSDRLFALLNYGILGVAFLLVSYPLLYILSASFSSTSAVIAGEVWLFPVRPSLAGYEAVFANRYIVSGYGNTIFYAVSGTLVNLIVTTLAAYPLSRKDLKTRNFFMLFFAVTMFFHGGLIPTYLLINRLGLLNTRWVMILPPALNVWNMIIMRTFFEHTISKELLDAAQIDGCSDIGFLTRVVLPLSGAIIAVMTLFYAVFHWNAFFHAFIYLSDRKYYPLQLILREILILSQIDVSQMASASVEELEKMQGLKDLLKYSLIVVASVSVLIMYPFIQKHFVQGVMIGSIKG